VAGDNVIDLSKPVKPIIFDPGTNEFILKQRDTPGLRAGTTEFYWPAASPVTETEFLLNGKMFYRRVVHHQERDRLGDEIIENVEIHGSRLPGPTNGGLDQDPRLRWILTGSPIPPFVSKFPGLDLEERLRVIMARAAGRLNGQVSDDFIAMLKDPVTITLFVLGVTGFVAVHLSSATGIGGVIALVTDVIAVLIVSFTLGMNAIPFFRAFIDFLSAAVDGETDEELDEAAKFLAQMISIIVIAAGTALVVVIFKGAFLLLSDKAARMLKVPLKPPAPLKRKFWWVETDPLASAPVALTGFRATLIKRLEVIKAAKTAFEKSYKNYRARIEHGFFIVEEADGSLSTIDWPPGGSDHITMPATETRPGRGVFFNGKKVRGTVHTHPVFPTDAIAGGNAKINTFPSKADGKMADILFRESKGANVGEHYVIAGDNVYVFDHVDGGRFAIVGKRADVIGLR
jgi:hypothetical protein